LESKEILESASDEKKSEELGTFYFAEEWMVIKEYADKLFYQPSLFI